jgi:hypothetical protein
VWQEEAEKVMKKDGQLWAVALLLRVMGGQVAWVGPVGVGEGLGYDGGS